MELLQLIVNKLTLILLLIGLPYILYLWFNGAVAMFRFQRSYKPEISFLRRCAPYNVFDDEAAAEIFTEEGLTHRRDVLKYLFRFLTAIAVMTALGFLAVATQSGG